MYVNLPDTIQQYQVKTAMIAGKRQALYLAAGLCFFIGWMVLTFLFIPTPYGKMAVAIFGMLLAASIILIGFVTYMGLTLRQLIGHVIGLTRGAGYRKYQPEDFCDD